MRAWLVERVCLGAALAIILSARPAVAEDENPLTAKPYGAQRRSVYHTYECGMGRLIADKNRMVFDSVEEAEKSGRRLCGFCRRLAEKKGHPIKTGSNGAKEGEPPPQAKEQGGEPPTSRPAGGGSAKKSNKKKTDTPLLPPTKVGGAALGAEQADDPPPELTSGRMVKVLPGGTIVLESAPKIRLLGVVFPAAGQPPAEDAVRFAEEQMRDRVLYFSYSLVAPAPDHRDELGRLLTYVKPDKDGRDLAGELLFQGYVALDRTAAFDRQAEYERRESEAFAARRGLWKPLDGRAGRAKVVIGDHAHCYHPVGCLHVEQLTHSKEVSVNQAKARRLVPCSEFRGP